MTRPSRRRGYEGRQDSFFDPWLIPSTGRGKASLGPLRAVLEANETRERKRRLLDRQTWASTADTFFANLVMAVLEPPPSNRVALPLAKPRQKLTRYDRHGLSPTMLAAILKQGVGEFFTLSIGRSRGVASTIEPTPAFAEWTRQEGLSVEDFTRRDGEEVLILSAKHQGEHEGDGRESGASVKRIDYRDTVRTHAMRGELQELNAFLATADIAFVQDGLEPVYTRSRRLRRHFSQHPQQIGQVFEFGGRLFGAFWSNLARERRRASLRIDGERIAEVDFSALFIRLAYAARGLTLIDDDPYSGMPGFKPQHRASVKAAINALFFAPGLKRWPEDVREGLPEGWPVARLKALVLERLPGLADELDGRKDGAERDARELAPGFRFMRMESDILMLALKRLREAGVVALPLHDAVLVARSSAEAARKELEAAALMLTGGRIPVAIKQGPEG